MKYSFYLILALLFTSLVSFSQSNYKPGYVISLKGDTIRGYIDYRDWSNNPEEISFKNSLQSQPHTYGLSSINYFSINGITAYQKFTVRISLDATSTHNINTYRDTSSKMATIFLQILQQGKIVALYSFADPLKTRFYIAEIPYSTPIELVYRLYTDPSAVTNIHGSTVNENGYMNQLFDLAVKYNKDSDFMKKTIENASYNSAELIDIVKQINGYDKKADRGYNKLYPSAVFYAGVAANVATTLSNSGTPYNESGGKNYTSIFPKLNIGINAFGNPVTRRLVFAGELGLTGNLYNVEYNNTKFPYGNYNFKFNQYTLSFSPQILYNIYNDAKFRFFAGGGITINFYSYGNKAFTRSGGPNDLAVQPFEFDKFGITWMAKTGILLNNKYEIYAGYIFDDNVNSQSDNYFFLHSHELQLGINYHF